MTGAMEPPTESPSGVLPVSSRYAMSLSEYSFRPLLRDVRDPALAFRIGPAGKALRRDDTAERIARRMAFGAMAGAVHQIGAAIPLRGFRCVGLERLAVEEQKLPAAERAPHVEGKRHVVVAHAALHGRQRLDVGEQVAHVLGAHALVGGVGKRREVVAAVRRRALQHRGDEVRLAPFADAVVRVGREVRDVERAERRLQPKPAAEPRLVLLVGRRVAGGAAAGVEHGLAVCEIGCAVRERARRHRRRDGDEPEHREANNSSSNSEQDELAQHRRSLSAQYRADAPARKAKGRRKRPPFNAYPPSGQLFFAR